MRLPRNVSPAAARRRDLLVDGALGLLLALSVIVIAAGIGVVGFIGLLCALVLIPWYLFEGLQARRRQRRRGRPQRRTM